MPESHDEMLEVIKGLVMSKKLHYSHKVRLRIEKGWFEEEDLEKCICTATKIHKVEEDEMKVAMDGKKYTIHGRDSQGEPFYTCGKIVMADDGRKYFIITARDAT